MTDRLGIAEEQLDRRARRMVEATRQVNQGRKARQL